MYLKKVYFIFRALYKYDFLVTVFHFSKNKGMSTSMKTGDIWCGLCTSVAFSPVLAVATLVQNTWLHFEQNMYTFGPLEYFSDFEIF